MVAQTTVPASMEYVSMGPLVKKTRVALTGVPVSTTPVVTDFPVCLHLPPQFQKTVGPTPMVAQTTATATMGYVPMGPLARKTRVVLTEVPVSIILAVTEFPAHLLSSTR